MAIPNVANVAPSNVHGLPCVVMSYRDIESCELYCIQLSTVYLKLTIMNFFLGIPMVNHKDFNISHNVLSIHSNHNDSN